MTFRVFRGNVLSLNGWRMCNEDECTWWTIPGTTDNYGVNLQIRNGIPSTILVRFAQRFNEVIEPLHDNDSACWTLNNDVDTSNHPAGIAMDLNWGSHPFHAYNTFGDKLDELRHLLDVEFRGCVGWGGDWGGNPQDEMHFEIAHQEGFMRNGVFILDTDQRLIDLANDLGALPDLPVVISGSQQYALACIKEGQRLGISPRGIIIGLSVELVETNLTMYVNQLSKAAADAAGIHYDKVGSDHDSDGLFQQRPPWGSLADRMDPTRSATIFFTVDHGYGVRGLTKIRDINGNFLDYNDESRTPGFYAQKVQGSAFPDRYDERMKEAAALYHQLTSITTTNPPVQPGGGDVMAIDQPAQSISPFRALGEGARWTPLQMSVHTDGFTHPQFTGWAAGYGHSPSLQVLRGLAEADPEQWPDRADDIKLAQAVLRRVLPGATATAPETLVPEVESGPVVSPVLPPVPTSTVLDQTVPTSVVVIPSPTETVTVRPITQTQIARSTVVHSIITVLGSVGAVAPWVLQSFGDHMSTTATMIVSGVAASAAGLLDFLVKTEKQVPTKENKDGS